MRLQLITCDMLMLPVEHLAARSPNEIVVSDLSASLHVEPVPLRDRIQERVDQIEAEDPDADAILLGYGLCGGATAGLIPDGYQGVCWLLPIGFLAGPERRFARPGRPNQCVIR